MSLLGAHSGLHSDYVLCLVQGRNMQNMGHIHRCFKYVSIPQYMLDLSDDSALPSTWQGRILYADTQWDTNSESAADEGSLIL